MRVTKAVFDEGGLLFYAGVFSAMEYLVLEVDQPTLAAEIAKAHDIDSDFALRLSRRSGYRAQEMNAFIRDELKPTATKKRRKKLTPNRPRRAKREG